MNITYTNHLSAEEFNGLRADVGWTPIDHGLVVKGLENTAFVVCARDGEKAIGMARVITDFGYVYYIANVVVSPEYQGKGIGREIMTRILAYINNDVSGDQVRYIALMAAEGKEEFYEKFGFLKRPSGKSGCGMTMWVESTEV